MKKLIALCLAMLLCLSVFAACGTGKGNEETTTAGKEETTAGKEETTTAGTENTTEETTSGSTYDLEAAIAYLDSMYKKEYNITAADYEVAGQVLIGLDKYMVAWAVDSDKVAAVEGSPYWTIQVDEMSKETVNYKITATVTAPDGTTATVSYDRVVPEFIVTSFEDYMAATEGTVTVAGIVVGINAKSAGNTRNHLFLADVDGKGGYYCYQLDKDPLEEGVELGMIVAVTAPVSPYSGMQETKGGDFVIVDKTIKEIPVLDITEIFAAGESLKNYVGLVVTIKGVTITDQVLGGTSEYLNFELNGQKAYVRTYVTDFPTTLKAEDKATIDAAHAENFGNTANATGILVLYSGAPYLIPTSTDCFSDYTVVTKTDAEKVEAEKEGLKLPASYSSDTVVDLAAKGQYYDDVAITWALTEENAAATLADGKLTLVVPDSETVVKLTATITCGEVTDTKSFEIKLSKSITSIKDAIEIGAAKDHNTYTEEKYLIAGIIKDVYQTTYGNMHIVDELGNEFTVYGTFIEGKKYGEFEGAKPVAGDYVVVLGILGQYNGTAQTKNADIISFTTPITIPAANELGNTFEKGQYTEDKKIITGEITEIQNSKYGNVVIKDADGNSILVYGLYSSNGATRYDSMATQPAVGDIITVLGVIGKYNDPQMKDGWLIAHTVAPEEDTEGTEGTEGTEATDAPEIDTPEDTNAPEGTVAPEGTNTPEVDTPENPGDEATAYTMQMVKTDNVPLYFNGSTADATYRLATTTNAAEAVQVYLEAVDGVEGAYRLYFMNGNTKTYIRVYEYQDGNAGWGKGSLELTTTVPAEYLTYDATARTYIYTADADNSYYLGTYGDYTTFSASNTYYITGDNAANVDVTQFPARLVEVAE